MERIQEPDCLPWDSDWYRSCKQCHSFTPSLFLAHRHYQFENRTNAHAPTAITGRKRTLDAESTASQLPAAKRVNGMFKFKAIHSCHTLNQSIQSQRHWCQHFNRLGDLEPQLLTQPKLFWSEPPSLSMMLLGLWISAGMPARHSMDDLAMQNCHPERQSLCSRCVVLAIWPRSAQNLQTFNISSLLLMMVRHLWPNVSSTLAMGRILYLRWKIVNR